MLIQMYSSTFSEGQMWNLHDELKRQLNNLSAINEAISNNLFFIKGNLLENGTDNDSPVETPIKMNHYYRQITHINCLILGIIGSVIYHLFTY